MSTQANYLGPYALAEAGCDGARMIALGDSDAYAKVFNDPDDAHAHLIVTAPELLETLKAVLQDWQADLIQRGTPFEKCAEVMAMREGYELARAVIAKAERRK